MKGKAVARWVIHKVIFIASYTSKTSFAFQNLIELKGMVHLIYKLHLKAVFMCIKFNGAIDFSEKLFFLT